jgi:hypothetical protein
MDVHLLYRDEQKMETKHLWQAQLTNFFCLFIFILVMLHITSSSPVWPEVGLTTPDQPVKG